MPSDSGSLAYASSAAQFEDMQNEMQALARSIDELSQNSHQSSDRIESRYQELTRDLLSADKLNARLNALEQKLEQNLNSIDQTVRTFDQRFSSLQNVLKDSHSSLAEGLPKHMSDSERPVCHC